MTVENLTVVKVNVQRMQSSQKRLKLIQYFKSQLGSKSLFFCKRLIQLRKTKRNGKTFLRVKFFNISEVKHLL